MEYLATSGALDAALDELAKSLPPGVLLRQPDRLDKYKWDRALDPNAATPLAAVRAERTEHMQTALRWASKHRVPVVPHRAGSGLSGGATGLADGIVVSTERMRDIPSVDPATRIAVVQPGLLNAEVKRAVAEVGLWYPPDPSSYEFCSIGGNVATNAGALCCVKYGMTTDYVLGLEVVLADGRAVRLGGPRLKDVAGLSLTRLFVGSEGTLGVITEITLRLMPPQQPAHTLVAWFADTHDATGAILDITSKIRPSMLEYMDRVAINAVEDDLHMGLDREAAALVVAQSDNQNPAAGEVEVMLEACRRNNAADVLDTSDQDEGEMFVAVRRAAIPAVEKRGRQLLEDVGVPLLRLPEWVAGVGRIGVDSDVMIAVIAHADDGNTHPLIVFDPADAAMERRANFAFGEIMDLAIGLGATITGEHGVGRLKRPWLENQVGPDVLDISRAVKGALDPLDILNPGSILA
ncbi:MAG TPA: FAD-linked oxidase C-terminal domain-containing protein [Trebonia sp.]